VRDAWRIHRKRPFLAWDNTWFNAPCRTWPAPSRAKLTVSGAAVSAKILLINETLDAATPYSGALRVRSLFPSARLIAGVGGTTHAGSLNGVACVDQRIAAYLGSDGNMGDDNGYAVYLAVQCTDVRRPAWSTQVRDAWRIHRKRPFLAWDNTWFNAPCRTWPAPSQAKLAVSGAAVSANILLVNETRDAATPYSGALRVRSLFPSARLIAGVGGTTHAGSLNGVACVDQRIAAYLGSDGTNVPARVSGNRADVNCPKVPAPMATGGSRLAGPGGLPDAVRTQLAAAQRSSLG
jgi:hypothetical protein